MDDICIDRIVFISIKYKLYVFNNIEKQMK
jgi:hypothetical protein